MTSLLSEELGTYLDELRVAYPAIEEIWLIGSRANNGVHAGSDWDFVAFADEETCQQIEVETRWHRADVDLLVVIDGDSFKRAWGKPKSGSLKEWSWKQNGPTSATYIGTKWSDDDEAWAEQVVKAVRVR
jgi:hypothetical protein